MCSRIISAAVDASEPKHFKLFSLIPEALLFLFLIYICADFKITLLMAISELLVLRVFSRRAQRRITHGWAPGLEESFLTLLTTWESAAVTLL